MAQVLIRNWWALALRGVFGILFGLVAFLFPGITLGALILLFAIYAVLDGLFAIVAAIRAAERHERWGVLLLEGIAGIVAGLLAFVWPAGRVAAWAQWSVLSPLRHPACCHSSHRVAHARVAGRRLRAGLWSPAAGIGLPSSEARGARLPC